VILTMPEDMSSERINLLRAYGAQIVLTPREQFMQGAIAAAEKIIRENPDYFMPQQFRNSANPDAHRKTTANEILAVVGNNLNALVVGIGTGGTVTGSGEILKKEISGLKVYAVEPAESPFFSTGKAGPHRIQGIGAGFVPQIFNRQIVDQIVTVTYDQARTASRRLANLEGILCGVSSGAILHAAIETAQMLGRGNRVLAILPDTGERYLSTDLFS